MGLCGKGMGAGVEKCVEDKKRERRWEGEGGDEETDVERAMSETQIWAAGLQVMRGAAGVERGGDGVAIGARRCPLPSFFVNLLLPTVAVRLTAGCAAGLVLAGPWNGWRLLALQPPYPPACEKTDSCKNSQHVHIN